MKKALTLILIFFYISSRVIYGQWTNFNNTNTKALDATVVSDIVSTDKNIIWFGTEKGIIRNESFMGTWWWINNLPNNFVYDLHVDDKQNLWIGTNGGGAVRYDGQSLKTFDSDNGLGINIVRGITQDKNGNIWFATYGGGLGMLVDNKIKSFGLKEGLPTKYFYTAYCDIEGNLWFGTSGKGVVKYDGISWKVYNTDSGLVSNTILKIYDDKSHRKWFCGQGGISILSGNKFENLTTGDGLADEMVYCVTEGEDGNFLIGTGNGLNIYDGFQMQRLDTSNGLANNTILCIVKDESGKYWYGHPEHGVSCYDGTKWKRYGEANGLLTSYIYKSAEGRDGKLWFATNNGLSCFNGYSWKTYDQSNSFNCIAIDSQDNIWVSSYSKLYKYDGKTWQTINLPLASSTYKSITSIDRDNSGNIWIGYYYYATQQFYGVFKNEKGKWTNYDNNNSPITSNVNKVFNDSKGNIWIATNYGLLRKTQSNWGHYTKTDGLANNYVKDIAEDKGGNLWVACNDYYYGGVSVFNGSTWKTYREEIHTHDVMTLLVDSKGMLWIGGNYYYYENNHVVFTRYYKGEWDFYTSKPPGLPYTHTINDIMEDKNKNLWVCTPNGISRAALSSVGIADSETEVVKNSYNYPNPFVDMTRIKFDLNDSGSVEVKIISIDGRTVREYRYYNMLRGENEITIEKGDLKEGVYFYSIIGGEQRINSRMVIAE
jgi:ligand-binding sensor domain-containing protein